ncbi:hypothetical protein BU15DRAFT_76302 [Melanogaster broomeanus]|nr:hypothetical protein BU15DRAFT_76302 [Melanogaster broomeanus]
MGPAPPQEIKPIAGRGKAPRRGRARFFRDQVVIFCTNEADQKDLINLLIGEYHTDEYHTDELLNEDGEPARKLFYRANRGSHSLILFPATILSDNQVNEQDFLHAVEEASRLIASIPCIDFGIYCCRPDAPMSVTEQHCKFIHHVLFRRTTPLAMVTANMSGEALPDDWWDNQAKHFQNNGVTFAAHHIFTSTFGPEGPRGENAHKCRADIFKLVSVGLGASAQDSGDKAKAKEDEQYVGSSESQPHSVTPEARRAVIQILTKRVGLSKALAKEVVPRIAALNLQRYVDDISVYDSESLLDLPASPPNASRRTATGEIEFFNDNACNDAVALPSRPPRDSASAQPALNGQRMLRLWNRMMKKPSIQRVEIAAGKDKQPLYVYRSDTDPSGAADETRHDGPEWVTYISESSSSLAEDENANVQSVPDEVPHTKFCCF